jgi:hypothetical protein
MCHPPTSGAYPSREDSTMTAPIRSRGVDADWQTAPQGLPHQPLGDPLGLSVAVLAGFRKLLEVGLFLAQAVAWREDAVRRDVVHGLRPVAARQAQDLARTADVGRLQRRVRIDEVHHSGRVDYQVHLFR